MHDLPGVGANLHDHVDVVQVVDAPHLKDLFGLSPAGLVRAVRASSSGGIAGAGMLTTNFAEAGGFIRSQPEEPIPDLQLHFVIGKLVDHGRKTTFGHGYSCHVCLLRPLSRGTRQAGRRRPVGRAADRPELPGRARRHGPHGARLQADAHDPQQPALAGHGGRELAVSAGAISDAQIEQFIRDKADTIYHPVGSVPDGHGPMDVVDAQLRVHGVDGLRVVDASIMPRVVGGNTNAPVIMIAEKAADMIKDAARA